MSEECLENVLEIPHFEFCSVRADRLGRPTAHVHLLSRFRHGPQAAPLRGASAAPLRGAAISVRTVERAVSGGVRVLVCACVGGPGSSSPLPHSRCQCSTSDTLLSLESLDIPGFHVSLQLPHCFFIFCFCLSSSSSRLFLSSSCPTSRVSMTCFLCGIFCDGPPVDAALARTPPAARARRAPRASSACRTR
jgi:hypothetical protein